MYVGDMRPLLLKIGASIRIPGAMQPPALAPGHSAVGLASGTSSGSGATKKSSSSSSTASSSSSSSSSLSAWEDGLLFESSSFVATVEASLRECKGEYGL